MGKLSNIVNGGDGGVERFRETWDKTDAAGEQMPLPAGEYIAHVVSGQLERSQSNNTPGYRLKFRVTEGEHTGRCFWHDLWLTELALPYSKRDLAKFGITSPDQLERPLPQGFRCCCKVALRRGDDGVTYNRVRSFSVIAIDPPETDAFAPTDEDSPDSDTRGAKTTEEVVDLDQEIAGYFEDEEPEAVVATSPEITADDDEPDAGRRVPRPRRRQTRHGGAS
jgi:hypothetical protein